MINTSEDGLVHEVNHLQGVGDDGMRFSSLLHRRTVNGEHRVRRGLRKRARSMSQVTTIASRAASDVVVCVAACRGALELDDTRD